MHINFSDKNTGISRREGLLIVAGTVAVVTGFAAGPVAAQTAATRSFDLDIRRRRVDKARRTIRVTRGDRVVLNWTTDEAVELHLHGYDIPLKVTPGTSRSMIVEAKIAGRFPISGHGFGHHSLAYLEVHPR